MADDNKEHSVLPRRLFLKRAACAGAALAVPGTFAYGRSRASGTPLRVRGRVTALDGTGLSGVGVTDGRRVVETGTDGRFELHSSMQQHFVYLSVPAGYRIPRSETGTARFYQPLRPDANGEMQVHFELEPLGTSDETHAFLAVADPQAQDEREMDFFLNRTVPDLRETARAMDASTVFGVTCGDITFDSPELYPEYEAGIRRTGVPFFQVLGNHDMDYGGRTDEASAQTFRGQFGPPNYSFDRGAVHYIVLDNVFWNRAAYFGYLDGEQMAWLEQDLARVEEGRPVVVFMHIPALSTRYRREGKGQPNPSRNVTNREALYALLEPYQSHIITGHTHENEHVFEQGTHEQVCGTACGAWWTGPVCTDGTPNGYAVYEVEGERIRWRYKATRHGADHQLRVYSRGSDPEAPDEFVANVWNWDPEWEVRWFADGEPRGSMARRVGLDPLARRRYQGDEKPERRSWVDPVPTGHLFYAPQPADAERIRVEATDRWGRTYTAHLNASASGSETAEGS